MLTLAGTVRAGGSERFACRARGLRLAPTTDFAAPADAVGGPLDARMGML